MLIYDILIDFVAPLTVIAVAAFLLVSGIDGEVKSILMVAAGWAFHSSFRRLPPRRKR